MAYNPILNLHFWQMAEQPQNDSTLLDQLNPKNETENYIEEEQDLFDSINVSDFTVKVIGTQLDQLQSSDHPIKLFEDCLPEHANDTMTTHACQDSRPENSNEVHQGSPIFSNPIAVKPAYLTTEDKNNHQKDLLEPTLTAMPEPPSNLITELGLNAAYKCEEDYSRYDDSQDYKENNPVQTQGQRGDITLKEEDNGNRNTEYQVEQESRVSQVPVKGRRGRKPGQRNKYKKKKRSEEDDDEEYKIEEEEEEDDDDEDYDERDDLRENRKKKQYTQSVQLAEGGERRIGIGDTNMRMEYTLFEDWRIIKATDEYIKGNGSKGLQSITQWEKLHDPDTGEKLLVGLRSSESMRDRYKRYITLLNDEDRKRIQIFSEEHTKEEMMCNHCLFKKINKKRKFIGISDKLNYDPGRIKRHTPYNTKYKGIKVEEKESKIKKKPRKRRLGETKGSLEKSFENGTEDNFDDQIYNPSNFEAFVGDDISNFDENEINIAGAQKRKYMGQPHQEIYEETYQGEAQFQLMKAAKQKEKTLGKAPIEDDIESLEGYDIYWTRTRKKNKDWNKKRPRPYESKEAESLEKNSTTAKKLHTGSLSIPVQVPKQRGRKKLVHPASLETQSLKAIENLPESFASNGNQPKQKKKSKFLMTTQAVSSFPGNPFNSIKTEEMTETTSGLASEDLTQSFQGMQGMMSMQGLKGKHVIYENQHGLQAAYGMENIPYLAQGMQGEQRLQLNRQNILDKFEGQKRNLPTGLKNLQVDEDFANIELRASERFKRRQSLPPFRAKKDIAIFVDYGSKFRQFVFSEALTQTPKVFLKTPQSLKEIASKYHISIDAAVHYFNQVSCNYDDFEEYLKNLNNPGAGTASLLWTQQDDKNLLSGDIQALRYLEMIKGPERVQARREYLKENS